MLCTVQMQFSKNTQKQLHVFSQNNNRKCQHQFSSASTAAQFSRRRNSSSVLPSNVDNELAWVWGPSKFAKHFQGLQNYVSFENMWNKMPVGDRNCHKTTKGLACKYRLTPSPMQRNWVESVTVCFSKLIHQEQVESEASAQCLWAQMEHHLLH